MPKKTTARRNFFMIFAVLLALFIVAVPHHNAWADDSASVTLPPCPDIDKELQKYAAQDALAKTQAANAVLGLFGAIDVKAATCFQKISDIFSTLGSLSDPLGLIFTLIANQILAMLDQLCSSVLNTIEQVKSFALSQFNRLCLPLPDFGMGNLNVNLGLQNVTCSGVSLYNPGGGNSLDGTPPLIDFRSYYPQKQ